MGTDNYLGFDSSRGRARRHAPPPHDRWLPGHLTGELSLELTTWKECYVTPGTGTLRSVDGVDGKVLAQTAARRLGEPVLPGSGIKGAVRALYELLSPSCDLLQVKGRHRVGAKCEPWSCCEACSLFGTLGHQGRLSFTDAVAAGPEEVTVSVERIPFPHEPKPERTAGDFRLYHLGPARYQGKNQPEEMAREVYRGRFVGHLLFTNATEEELGRVLFCLGLRLGDEAPVLLRLGGARFHGQGALLVRPLGLTLVTKVLEREHLEAAGARDRVGQWMKVARSSDWWDEYSPILEEVSQQTCLGGAS